MNRKDSEKKVKLSRIARIDEEIRSGRYPNSEELAAKMEVNPRTILRDIEHLRLYYDAPIEYDFNKKGFYYSEPNFFIKSVLLTEDEVKTVSVYDDVLKLSNEDDFHKKFRSAIGKVLSALPENLTKNIHFSPSDEHKNDFLFEPKFVLEGEILANLLSAINKKKIIEMEYWTTNNRKFTLYTLEPLHIFYQRHFYYLLAYKADDHEKPGVYSTARINKIHITNRHFEIPSNLKMSDYVKEEADVSPADNKIYLFELSFPKEIASIAIERTYYPNQTVELREDSTVFVTFRSTELYEVFYWVLGEGHKVKVVNPPELVSMIKREIQRVGQYYV